MGGSFIRQIGEELRGIHQKKNKHEFSVKNTQ
jgi:hypothetical protein